MTRDEKLFSEAESYVVHVSKNKYQCPACGEETCWKTAAKDFVAGANWQREQDAELLKAYEALVETVKFCIEDESYGYLDDALNAVRKAKESDSL